MPLARPLVRCWPCLMLIVLLAACGSIGQPSPTVTRVPGVLAPDATAAPADVPALTERLRTVDAALAQPIPVIRAPVLSAEARAAEELALADNRLIALLRAADGRPLRTEVFQVLPLPPGDLSDATADCRQRACYRVEIYHYAQNRTSIAIVDPNGRGVLTFQTLTMQPADIPQHLAKLAQQIAAVSPTVREALGRAPTPAEGTMANIKTALNGTRCERSQHLCVAPTFMDGDRALWAIVDLTDYRVVGVQWSTLGASSPPITELSVQNSAITAQYCRQETALERDGWSLRYLLTSSDGLRVSDVAFQGAPVLRQAKLVDWHVAYAPSEQYPQGFGYSDAVGCPMFSAAAVPAFEPPQVEALQGGGFALTQSFRHPAWPAPCNYRYGQRYEFYPDGRFRVVAVSFGRGCGNNGTYRPVLRIAFAGDTLTASAWDGGAWRPWAQEQWSLQDAQTPYTDEGAQLRLATAAGQGYDLVPGRGQFPDNRGDNAWLFVTRYKAEEGDGDLITIGPCCNADARQGPEQFIGEQPEVIDQALLVVWYVPQLQNSDEPGSEYCWADVLADPSGIPRARAWPCAAGPLFVPVGAPASGGA